MLSGAIICPDQKLAQDLKQALGDTHRIAIVRTVARYLNGLDLVRFLRAAAPEVIFLSVQSRREALDTAQAIVTQAPGTQIVAVDRACDPEALMETMQAGIREFMYSPFDAELTLQAVERLAQILERHPPSIESSESLFAFLPSKAGVGCSTVALNTSVALAQIRETKVLLADFDLNCGIIGFMLQIESPYSVMSAAENAHEMDEDLWQRLVTTRGNLDILLAGKLAPGFRIEPAQIRHMLEFARRNYQAICIDLSGILEKFSVEILHEAKQIFLVCTPEVPSLHLAREKLRFLRSLDLESRIRVVMNRATKNPLIPNSEVEKLLAMPVYMSFPNDYQGVHKALTSGKQVNKASEMGKGFQELARAISGSKKSVVENKEHGLLEMILPRKRTGTSPQSVLSS